MNSNKANRLLERITALHKSLVGTADSDISSIEKDLMLSYLRQLYEEYASVGQDQSAVSTKVTQPLATTPPPPVATEEPVPPPPPRPTPPPPVAATPPPVTPSDPPSNRAELSEKEAVPSPPPPVIKPPMPAPSIKMSPKVAALFAPSEVKELSERLAQSPIKDLTRALTINNRVQFANVLFNGNSDLMNSVLKRLNGLGSMAAAKPVLVELANDHHWTEEETAPVARDFIKLVSRRYA